MLHRKLRQALDAEDLIEGSHDYKAAVALFDSFPKEELFAAPVDDLRRAVVALIALEGTDRVRLLGRRDPDGRSVSLILSLPRARYSEQLVSQGQRAAVRAVRERVRRGAPRARRGPARPRALLRARRRGPARGLPARPRGGGGCARPHVGRRPRRRARQGRPRAGRHLGQPLPRPLQGLHDAGARRDRRRLLHAPGRRRVVRGQPAPDRRREADARGALQARRQDRALARDADARGPRAARDRGDLDPAAWAGGGVGAGVPRARPGRAAARPRRRGRARGRGDRGGLPRCCRVRPAQPAGDHGRPGPQPGRHPARLPQVPPADRLALHRGLPERRAGGQLADHGQARALLRAALRPRHRDRRGRRAGAARRDPRRPRGGRLDRPRSHPAQPARRGRRHAAHERLQGRPRRDGVQAALGRRAGDPDAGAGVRDLRLRAGARGHPPARRQDRPRRHPLQRPHGLPHRGLRADAGAADQERDHRAGRRQGRLHRQARGDHARGDPGVLRHLHPVAARRHRQPGRRRGRASRPGARARRGRHLPRGGGRQGHGDVLRHRQRDRRRVRLLARRRVRLRRLGRLRPQEARDHRARRLGVGQAPLPRAGNGPGARRVHRRRDRRHVRRRVRQRDAAVGQDQAARRVRPPARVHRSRPGSGAPRSRSASVSSSCPARRGRTTRRSPRAAASTRATPSGSS